MKLISFISDEKFFFDCNGILIEKNISILADKIISVENTGKVLNIKTINSENFNFTYDQESDGFNDYEKIIKYLLNDNDDILIIRKEGEK